MRRPKRHQSKAKLQNEILELNGTIVQLRAIVADRTQELRKQKYAEETVKTAERIIDAGSRIDFRRSASARYYQLSLEFDGRLMGGVSAFRDDMRYLADYVANQVRGHIESSRFIKMADDSERAEYERQMSRYPVIGPNFADGNMRDPANG